MYCDGAGHTIICGSYSHVSSNYLSIVSAVQRLLVFEILYSLCTKVQFPQIGTQSLSSVWLANVSRWSRMHDRHVMSARLDDSQLLLVKFDLAFLH